ncbi:MAG: ribonuclease H-like domain-containing protein [Acidobacteriota bacterium]|nr:ribonuclease H-like domain-containing protein [Acidobacteriota bacterium]
MTAGVFQKSANPLSMNLEQKLQQLRNASRKSAAQAALEAELDHLRRTARAPVKLPAQRAPHGIEEYVEGRECTHPAGKYFLSSQSLPFGRPYGKLRIGDIAASDLTPLGIVGPALPDPARLLYLDTETTGLAGGTGTCAFLIGIGMIRGADFVVEQFFLRDYEEEKAVLSALADILQNYDGLVTFNGKTFDVPLLETRYTLCRLRPPFARLVHLDLLHPARRLWKLRLESCRLTHLEEHILGISRKGDVPGSDIPGIYFDYLRTGEARDLQPVFFHNAMDIVTLAALTVEAATVIRRAREGTALDSSPDSSIDLLCLSRIFEGAGESDQSLASCSRALAAGLPESLEPLALWQIASQHKRRADFQRAEQIWLEIARSESPVAIEACRELAIHYEHRLRDASKAIFFTDKAIALLGAAPSSAQKSQLQGFTHRRERLQRRLAAPALL